MGSGVGPGGAGQVNITLTGEVKAAACGAASSRSPGIPSPHFSLYLSSLGKLVGYDTTHMF